MSTSYRQIFKATTVLGGAQVNSIVFGIIRNKFLAVILGPAGVGLAGMLSSITSLTGTITGLGIPMSGVRQIASSVAQNDEREVAATVTTLRMITWITGLVGMCVLMAFAGPIAKMTFGDTSNAWALVVVAAVVLIEGLGATQKAILQGMRQITALSACQVLGAIGGTIAAIPLVVMFGEEGIAGFLVAASACATLASWWFARQVRLAHVTLTWAQVFAVLRGLLNVGIAVVVTGIIGAALVYFFRLIIIKKLALDMVGLYQAAWTLSSTYLGVVLGAMGTDFYPRLTGVIGRREEANRLINEQTEMGMLITLPGVLATVVLAPWILHVVYSSAFVDATNVLRWQILGDALKVISWPLGFISIAKGRGGLFMVTEGAFAVLQLLLFYVCVEWRQFEGAGIAFFLFYICYVIGIFFVARSLTGFSWSSACVRRLVVVVGVTGLVFALCRFGPAALSLPVGLLATAAATWWSLTQLKALLGQGYFAGGFNRLFRRTTPLSDPAEKPGGSGVPAAGVNEMVQPRGELSSATEEAGYYPINGEQVYYVYHRSNRPTAQILLPGHFVTERHFAYAPWVRWSRYLAGAGVSALRFDYRGCGESTGKFENFAINAWLEDCRALCAFLRKENPHIPIILGGIGLGGLLASQLFHEGQGDAMLLWSPSACGSDALRDTLLRRMAFDMSNSSGGGARSWSDYVAMLERGETVEAAGYLLTSQLWREALALRLFSPEVARMGGIDDRGRPWRTVKLGQSHVPLVPGGGLWQALNPRLRMRRAPLNPDLTRFFEENLKWIQSAVGGSKSKA